MKIKKLYCNPHHETPYIILQALDGRYYKIDAQNAHRLKDEEILERRPLPSYIRELSYYVARGHNAVEAPEYMYKACGFEKAEAEEKEDLASRDLYKGLGI